MEYRGRPQGGPFLFLPEERPVGDFLLRAGPEFAIINRTAVLECRSGPRRGEGNGLRILGIDPGYATIGFGLIEAERWNARMLSYGAITTPAGLPLSRRLYQISRDAEELIGKLQPDAISIEELFFNTNITTGIAVAHARGVILYTAQRMHLPVYEYTPMQIKQAVVGYGLADKHQVMDMTRRLLKLKSIPRPDDAADALAIAMCRARSATSLLRQKDPDVKETV